MLHFPSVMTSAPVSRPQSNNPTTGFHRVDRTRVERKQARIHVLHRTFVSLRSRNLGYPLSIKYIKRTLNSPAAKDERQKNDVKSDARKGYMYMR